MKALVLVLVAVAMLAFAGGSLLIPLPVTSSRSSSRPQPRIVEASRQETAEEAVDAYGNEVTLAVAEYSLDPAGTLYEEHAPQIELPRLGSPKS